MPLPSRSIRILWLALAIALVGCGPIGPFAGGALRGPVGPSQVSDWSFAEELKTAQLETRPAKPQSVTTWFAAVGPDLYVPTSLVLGTKNPANRGWVAHVAEDPRVRIRLGDRVFERVARRVEDETEFARAREALETKYGLDPSKRDPARNVWIFRLDPRPG